MPTSHLPDSLYHYTNTSGLTGILESRRLWATDVRFLNDASEVSYARRLLKAAVDDLKSQSPHDTRTSDQLALIEQLSRAPDIPPTFAACMCAEADLLSQWRAYGDVDGRYAIGLNRERLSDIAFEQNITLLPVKYDVSEQRRLLNTAVHDALEYLSQQRVQSAVKPDDRNTVIAMGLSETLLEVKNPHFREEAEWRLARTAWRTAASDPLTHFRSHHGEILPYQEFSLVDDQSGTSALEVVVVGPSAHADSRAEAVRQLLQHHGLHQVTVRISEIPLRA
jgi:hypothetical protein